MRRWDPELFQVELVQREPERFERAARRAKRGRQRPPLDDVRCATDGNPAFPRPLPGFAQTAVQGRRVDVGVSAPCVGCGVRPGRLPGLRTYCESCHLSVHRYDVLPEDSVK